VPTIIRLRDLGLEPFLIASTMLGALAQRLVRKICPHCIEGYQVEIDELQKMGFPVSGQGQIELKRGKGCKECRKTGYSGRMGIFEIFPMSDKLKQLITDRAPDAELRQVATREGMTTLNEDAWLKVRNGLTTVEEALRVSGDV
ncbi:MAG: type II/IV secretion system protein, partial [Candidatus Electrothrix sp. AR3]|nr:type II/IV secretion system protein [Candidatus Electrothrix sp. AR3]